jgi:hypothetical protein
MNIITEVHFLSSQLVRLREKIGSLDDRFESDCIDNRGPHSDLGAYQLLGRALRRLEQYEWELEEAESNGESE